MYIAINDEYCVCCPSSKSVFDMNAWQGRKGRKSGLHVTVLVLVPPELHINYRFGDINAIEFLLQ